MVYIVFIFVFGARQRRLIRRHRVRVQFITELNSINYHPPPAKATCSHSIWSNLCPIQKVFFSYSSDAAQTNKSYFTPFSNGRWSGSGECPAKRLHCCCPRRAGWGSRMYFHARTFIGWKQFRGSVNPWSQDPMCSVKLNFYVDSAPLLLPGRFCGRGAQTEK